MGKNSVGESTFALHCRAYGLEPQSEFRFHPERKWRVDFAFEVEKIAVEIEGGVWSGGRHNRGSGYIGDMEKYNALTLLGWKLLRFSTQMVESGLAVDTVRKLLESN